MNHLPLLCLLRLMVKALAPSTVTVPEPRSVATAAQWAPWVSMVRSEPLMTPA